MFTPIDRNQIQPLAAGDTRVTGLEEEITELLGQLTSLDIALSNRDYVGQRVSEQVAHELLGHIRGLLIAIAEPR